MNRFVFFDLFKLVAAQLIVLHHLSAYGPMADALSAQWPDFMHEFYRYSRIAVQVFLVIGGYLAAQAIRPQVAAPQLILRRYLRLMPSYVLALAFITGVVWVMRPHISGDWLVEPPQVGSVVAHLLLLQGVLDQPALSTGVWYVAIDFQLFALLALVAAVSPSARILSWLVAALTVASIWGFNRIDELDNWAIYFMGTYGMGVLAGWSKRSTFDRNLFWVVAWLALAALWFEPRTRLGVALATALMLPLVTRWQTARLNWTSPLTDSAYAMFLTHFGIIVLMSALWEILELEGTALACIVSMASWGLSMLCGLAFHRWGEAPLLQWVKRFDAPRSATHTSKPPAPWPQTGHTPQTSPRFH